MRLIFSAISLRARSQHSPSAPLPAFFWGRLVKQASGLPLQATPLFSIIRDRGQGRMGYVAQFKHDIFVSYAHIDDERFGRQWVTKLAGHLKDCVSANLSRGKDNAVSVW